MRRVVLVLATMALAILLASGIAQAIINGEPDGNMHPYVGALVTEFEVAEGETELLPACSGTLISPTVFLTAGHCTEFLIEENLPTYVSFDSTFVPGESELVSGTPYLHPDYCVGCGPPGVRWMVGYDVGVVVLDEPVEMETYGRLPSENLLDTLQKRSPLTVVGYGANDFATGGGPQQPIYPDIRQMATVEYLGTKGMANLVGEDVIEASRKNRGVVNLHTGISPYVKGGPNCTNWCLAQGWFHLIGNSVMWLDRGIDSGNLITTERTSLTGDEDQEELHWKVMEHAHDLYVRAISAIAAGDGVPDVPQQDLGTGPTFHNADWTARAMIRARWNFARRYPREVGAAMAPEVRLVALPSAVRRGS